MRAFASVLLPDPFGPMTAWTSPLFMPRDTPRRISRPSTLTRRSLISKSANSLPLIRSDVVGTGRVSGPHPARAHHVRLQQAPVEVQLVLAGVAGARGDVLDGAVAVSQHEVAVRGLGDLGHVTVLAGHLPQLQRPLLEVQAGEAGAVLGLHAAGPLGEEALQPGGVHEVDEVGRQLAVT